MRLTLEQIQQIKREAAALFGPDAAVYLFGSRVDDGLRGGDVDLMVELNKPVDQPSMKAARLGGRICRAMRGRRLDVVLAAPNLAEQPIHRVARERGLRL